jgi:YVTN family beta-propeller protein
VTHRSWLFRTFVLSLFLASSLTTVFAQHLVTNVPVGKEPRGVAVNPITNMIYVANVHSSNVSVIHKDTVTATIAVDTLPYVLAVNSTTNRIYAAGCNFITGAGSMVVVIDGNTNKVIEDITLNETCGLGTQGIALNESTNRVYVSDYDDEQEVVIDGATDQIVARVDLAGSLPLGVAVDLLTNDVWVTLDGPFGNVDVIDGASNTVVDTVTVGEVFVEGIAINSTTRNVYVTSSGPPSGLYVLDAGTRQMTAMIPIGQFANYVGLDPISNEVFVTDGQANTVTVLDGKTNQIGATVQLKGVFPVGVAANPVTRAVYITDFSTQRIEIMTER